jgi:hypothetical protein
LQQRKNHASSRCSIHWRNSHFLLIANTTTKSIGRRRGFWWNYRNRPSEFPHLNTLHEIASCNSALVSIVRDYKLKRLSQKRAHNLPFSQFEPYRRGFEDSGLVYCKNTVYQRALKRKLDSLAKNFVPSSMILPTQSVQQPKK